MMVFDQPLRFEALINGFVDTVTSGTCNPTGAEADIVRTLGKKFNFTPEFWIFEFKNQQRRWIELINAVGRGEAEFAAGSIVLADDGIVSYTSFIQSSAEFAIFYVNPTKELNLSKILMSFDLIVYLFAFLCLILIVILTITFTYLFNYGFENGRFILRVVSVVNGARRVTRAMARKYISEKELEIILNEGPQNPTDVPNNSSNDVPKEDYEYLEYQYNQNEPEEEYISGEIVR
ncbi:hypothetical protein WA026_015455 [Henosepilachna vigintioctopunctata]|uniref:Uncharacterized protein n=1 Tax=Henosepilachna vigintioctopunctata TaxID=420089 RepID=A0AAW1UEC7_9CUCU